MSQNPPMTIDAPVTIRVEQVELLSVTGLLDDPGLDQLQYRLDKLLDGGTRLLVADLSRVVGCDGRVFDLLARAQHLVGRRGAGCDWSGWARRCWTRSTRQPCLRCCWCTGPRGGPVTGR